MTGAWTRELVDAVDADNLAPHRTAAESGTLAVLHRSPWQARDHAALAVRDFRDAGAGPLATLRSDQVAHRFCVTTSASTCWWPG